jgi:Flp pilus assembly pilin Flp
MTAASAGCDTRQKNGLRRALAAFAADDAGQDVIEYGLLSAFIGIVTIAVWLSIEGHLRTSYMGFDAGTQNLWQPPDPGAS